MKDNEDDFYMSLASKAAQNSRCAKKHLGCVLVNSDDRVVSGTNGAPYPLKPCNPCPRSELPNGEQLQLCRAVHAERDALLNAAKNGVSTDGAILYANMGVPCGDCLLELCAAGIKVVVCSKGTFYDDKSKGILHEWMQKGLIFRIHDNGAIVDQGMTAEMLKFNQVMSEYLAGKLMH